MTAEQPKTRSSATSLNAFSRSADLLTWAGVFLSIVLDLMALSARGVLDFTGFVIGARLLGTRQLYDVTANVALQKALTGSTNEGVIFVRLPFYALPMKAFTVLPYGFALFTWRLLLIGALVAFVWYFPLARRRRAALAICWSFPAVLAIWRANDSPFILLFIALSLFFWNTGRERLAGAMLGLSLAKFQFLIFLPFLLFQRRYRRVALGTTAVAAALTLTNFVVQPDWIRLYWQCLNLPQRNMNARATLMPNFYASFFWTGHRAFGVVLGIILVGTIVWFISRRFSFEIAMPLCLLGGLLAAPHTNHLDGVLAIPALLVAADRFPQLQPGACFLLSPLAAGLYCLGPECWGPAVYVLGCLWLMYRVCQAQREVVISRSIAASGIYIRAAQ